MELELNVRRYLTYAPDGSASVEANFRPEEKAIRLRTEETALILVDCWDHHYIDTHLARAKAIVDEVLAPATKLCREVGILVVHAPGVGVAPRMTEWMENPEDWDRDHPEPDWPPSEFLERTGSHAELKLSYTKLVDDWIDYAHNRMLTMRELGPEPGDVAVADGSQLHALLRKRRILHLLYAGFATNWCVPNKDYGMRAMATRGYNVVLFRDATTAVETRDTVATELMKEVAITTAEMMTGFSSTCAELRRACGTARSASRASAQR